MFKFFAKYFRLLGLAAFCLAALAIFLGWFWFFREKPRPATSVQSTAPVAVISAADFGHLILCGLDLYDIRTGALVAGNFLQGLGQPPDALHWRFDRKKLIAGIGPEFRQFALSGEADAAFKLPDGLTPRYAVNSDNAAIYYCDQGDLWRASVDWENGRFVAPARLTNVGYFEPQRFFGGRSFGTDKTLLSTLPTRGMIRIDLTSGRIEEFAGRMRNWMPSPDSEMLAGMSEDYAFCAYTLDTNQTQKFPAPARSYITKIAWLDKNRCLVVRGQQTIFLFNRETMNLSELVKVPKPIKELARPSPTGRYVLAEVLRGYMILDLEKPAASQVVEDDLADADWVSATGLLVNRRMADSEKRGTWLTDLATGHESRLLLRPFSQRAMPHPSVVRMPDNKTVLLLVEGDLWQFNPDGSDPKQLTKTNKVTRPLRLIEPWPEPETR